MASSHLALYLCCFMAIAGLSTITPSDAARHLLEASEEEGVPEIPEIPEPVKPSLPEIHFPELPKAKLPDFHDILPNIPEIPKLEIPNIGLPKLEIPNIDIPKLVEMLPTITTIPNEQP